MTERDDRRRLVIGLTRLTGLAVALPVARAARAQMPTQAPPLGAGYVFLLPKLTGGAPVREGRVLVDTPPLADNGHSVAMRVVVERTPGAEPHVRSLTLLSDRNPRPVILKAFFNARSARAELVTRVRLNGTQRVLALAELSDGSWWSGHADVVVTESACLDGS